LTLESLNDLPLYLFDMIIPNIKKKISLKKYL